MDRKQMLYHIPRTEYFNIHQTMIAISSSNMNFLLNLERSVNLVVLNVSCSEPLMPFKSSQMLSLSVERCVSR